MRCPCAGTTCYQIPVVVVATMLSASASGGQHGTHAIGRARLVNVQSVGCAANVAPTEMLPLFFIPQIVVVEYYVGIFARTGR